MNYPRSFRRLALALALLFALPAVAQPIAETHPVGAHVTLWVVVDGAPPPSVEWFKNGVKFGEAVQVSPGTWHLVIGVIGASDAGIYTAKASNVAGSATSDTFTLSISNAPSKPTIRSIVKRPIDTQGATLPSTSAASPAKK